MTGGQQNPGTGKTLSGQFSPAVDLVKLCEAFGVGHIRTVDPYDLKAVETAIKDALNDEGASVIIAQGPCVLEYRIKHEPWVIDAELCTCLLYTSPSPRDRTRSRMPSSA